MSDDGPITERGDPRDRIANQRTVPPVTARHDKATSCDCKDGGHDDGTGRCLCGGAIHRVPVGGVVHRVRDETRTATDDKPTERRTEAAAVDQAIADVRIGLDKGCTCGKTNHDLRGVDIDAYHDENDCRLCVALAALRVLADAVEELRLSLYSRDILLSLANGRLEAAEAENVRLQEERFGLRDQVRALSDENFRLARQVADLEAALHGIADDGACASDSRVARAALAARSRDPQEGA